MITHIDMKTVIRGRKNYECFGCLETIGKGNPSIILKEKNGKKLENIRLCMRCGYLCGIKTKNAGSVSRGELQAHLLANCLKKAWKEFLKNPAFPNTGQDPVPQEKPFRMVISNAEMDEIEGKRVFLYIPIKSGKLKTGDFPAGRKIMLCAGVRGRRKEVSVRKAWHISEHSAKQCLKLKRECIALWIQKERKAS